MKPLKVAVACGCLLLLISACSTVTPYSGDISDERLAAQAMTPAEAVAVIQSKVKVPGDYADYDGFALDDQGFSTVKTSERTETKWKDGKAIKVNVTSTRTRNVSWSSIEITTSYLRQYSMIFKDAHVVHMSYNISSAKNGQRRRNQEDIEFSCSSYEDLIEVIAAVRTLGE